MAHLAPNHQLGFPMTGDASDFWEDVANLGVSNLVRMADGPDFIGTTSDGRYVRIPDPAHCCGEERMRALLMLVGHCMKWYD